MAVQSSSGAAHKLLIAGRSQSFSMERVTAFPSSTYILRQPSTAEYEDCVHTRFNYLFRGK